MSMHGHVCVDLELSCARSFIWPSLLAIASWLYFIDTLEISKREIGCVDFGDHI
jgi:hypothetical protein